jgi:predicted permease
MRHLRVAWTKVRALFQGDRLDRELTAELESHLAHHIDDNRRAGMNAADARRLALAKLGGIEQARERHRDARSFAWFEDARRDAVVGARQLRHNPVFALSAVLILTVGIGLNLTIFQLLNVTLLRPVPIANPGTLVRFDRVSKLFSSNGVPYPATQFIRHNNSVLAAVLTCHSTDAVWEDDLTERVRTSYVSANWFAELGYQAQMGRLFVEAVDEQGDAPAVVVVSHAFWKTHLSSGSVVGEAVRINDRPATIVGVAPADVHGLRLEDPQVWLLIDQIDQFNPGMAFKEAWGSHNTQLYGRLRPGVSPEAARDGLRATSRALAVLRPQEFQADEVLQPYSGRDGFRSPRDRRELQTLAFLAGTLTLAVLMVACANLSNMVLSRSIGRLRELSLRAALGATRGRLLRQHLAESVLLTVAGALGGFLLSRWGIQAAAASTSLPAYLDFAPDWRMVMATCVGAALATASVGLVPAWMVIRRDLIAAMKDGGHQTSQGLARAPLRSVLVGLQVAGCSVLLIVAGLSVRGVQRLLTADRGFEFEQVAVLDPALARYGVKDESARAYWAEVERTIRASNPDVELALASQAPLGGGVATSKYNDAPELVVSSFNVAPSFLPLLRIPIVAGRNFDGHDQADRTIIISRRLAVEMYGTVDVVGKGFPRSASGRTIVGVAADAPLTSVTASRVAEQYGPVGAGHYGTVLLLARISGNPERLLAPMRAAARAADGRVLPRTWLPSAQFEQMARERRVASLVAMLVGILALSLACFGIVGLVACSVSVRMKEVGIRRALGAEGRSIVALLLRQLLLPVGLGLVVGTIAAIAVSRVLEVEPFYLPPIDMATLSSALGLFVLAAAIAVTAPLSRALSVDPLPALKHE